MRRVTCAIANMVSTPMRTLFQPPESSSKVRYVLELVRWPPVGAVQYASRSSIVCTSARARAAARSRAGSRAAPRMRAEAQAARSRAAQA